MRLVEILCCKALEVGAGAEEFFASTRHYDCTHLAVPIELADALLQLQQPISGEGVRRRVGERQQRDALIYLDLQHGAHLGRYRLNIAEKSSSPSPWAWASWYSCCASAPSITLCPER